VILGYRLKYVSGVKLDAVLGRAVAGGIWALIEHLREAEPGTAPSTLAASPKFGPPDQTTFNVTIPRRVCAVDVETTGLFHEDRVVTIGLVSLETERLCDDPYPWHGVHLIFNPGRANSPRALEIHGHADWELRFQEPFSLRAKAIRNFLDAHDLIVAHNAKFDLRFIDNEFALTGLGPLHKPTFCTMEAWRTSHNTSAALTSICNELCLAKAADHHGAFEDAWLALQVYLHLRGISPLRNAPLESPKAKIVNLKPAVPFVGEGDPLEGARPHAASQQGFSQPTNIALTEVGCLDNTCPNCGAALSFRPGRKTKCPHCGEFIFVRTRPFDRRRVLVTKEQATLIEVEWSSVLASKRFP
jgi:DNA polymerase-3 subunit epsilon